MPRIVRHPPRHATNSCPASKRNPGAALIDWAAVPAFRFAPCGLWELGADSGDLDVVWLPPGLKHWHGATATTAMPQVTLPKRHGRVGLTSRPWRSANRRAI